MTHKILIVGTDKIRMPLGTPVDVRLDSGMIHKTFTRSLPWQLGHGAWVVLLDGIVGGYSLDRVTPTGTPEIR